MCDIQDHAKRSRSMLIWTGNIGTVVRDHPLPQQAFAMIGYPQGNYCLQIYGVRYIRE